MSAGPQEDATAPTVPKTGIPSKIAEEITYITTGLKRISRKSKAAEDDEPLVDNTAALTLRSKKTERAQKRLQKKSAKAARKPTGTQLLDLPPELLQEILGFLRPSDIFSLSTVCQSLNEFVIDNESSIARDIIRQRYWVLSKSFKLPVALRDVDSSAHAALQSERYQSMLALHKKSYEHIRGIDPLKTCTCIFCVMSWNSLNLVLDLAHWQSNLDKREPLPIIPRGTAPEWNRKLLEMHGRVVEKAMDHPLTYARILEKHLATTVGTIMRTVKRKYTVHPRRLYYLTPADANIDTDEFLERNGPDNLEFPWRRDQYHYLDAFVPNRGWSRDKERWNYAQFSHEKDLEFVIYRHSSGTMMPPHGNPVSEKTSSAPPHQTEPHRRFEALPCGSDATQDAHGGGMYDPARARGDALR